MGQNFPIFKNILVTWVKFWVRKYSEICQSQGGNFELRIFKNLPVTGAKLRVSNFQTFACHVGQILGIEFSKICLSRGPNFELLLTLKIQI